MNALGSAGKRLTLVTVVAVLAALLLINRGVGADPPASRDRTLQQGPALVEPLAPPAAVLQYQGRLLDPATGSPKPNGAYQMAFSLYDVQTGGTALWTEVKNVTVGNGLFSTLLGDTTALAPAMFDGRALWLGVTVEKDLEATPRQRVAHAAYAMRAEDANTVDGRQATEFANTVHTHDAGNIISGALSTDRFSAMGDLLAESRIGSAAGQVAAGDHLHDSRYVNISGDTMSGTLAVPRIAYTTPRSHNLVIGGEGFVPGSNVPYVNSYGNGGAYIVSGSGALVAPVHLPQGAVVTEFKVFFYDNSASNMTVDLDQEGFAGGYGSMAQVASDGIAGYGNKTDTTIASAVIDNTVSSYLVYAFSTAWDSNLKIKGALITYTISEAE